MNYRVANMKFIKAEEANRISNKVLEDIKNEKLEDILEDINECIESHAEEGYDTLEYELEESKLLFFLKEYLEKQGYKVEIIEETEDYYANIVICWKSWE